METIVYLDQIILNVSLDIYKAMSIIPEVYF